MIGGKLLHRIDSLSNRSTAHLIVLILTANILLDTFDTSLLALASSGVKCLCKSIAGESYDLQLQEDIPTEVDCGSGEFDHCTCRMPDASLLEINVEHLNWLSDLDQIEVDLTCSQHDRQKRDTSEIDSQADDDTVHDRHKRSADEDAVTTEKKSNILSRTIKGAGNIVSGAGSAADTGIAAIGDAAGGAVTGGIHLIGTATKAVTGFVGSTVGAVGSVFEGSKTIKTKKTKRSTSEADSNDEEEKWLEITLPPTLSRERRSADVITNNNEFNGLQDGMTKMLEEITIITNLLNQYDNMEEAKKALLALADKEQDMDLKDVYVSFAGIIQPRNLDHQVDEVEVIQTLKSSNSTGSAIERIKTITTHLTEADDVHSFYTRMKNDNTTGNTERKLVEYLGTGLKKQFNCNKFSLDIKINPITSLRDVMTSLETRSEICEEPDDPVINGILTSLAKAPVHTRRKRSAITVANKVSKKVLKKASKPKKKKKGKKVIVADHAEEHEEGVDHPGSKKKSSKTTATDHAEEHDEGVEHPEEEIDDDDEAVEEETEAEHASNGCSCRCDPDTCQVIH